MFLAIFTFQRVKKAYSRGGWTKHHEHMLEYEEASARNPNPSISLRITEPDDEEEKNWKVKIVSGDPVSYTFLLYSCTASHFCSSLCLHLCM